MYWTSSASPRSWPSAVGATTSCFVGEAAGSTCSIVVSAPWASPRTALSAAPRAAGVTAPRRVRARRHEDARGGSTTGLSTLTSAEEMVAGGGSSGVQDRGGAARPGGLELDGHVDVRAGASGSASVSSVRRAPRRGGRGVPTSLDVGPSRRRAAPPSALPGVLRAGSAPDLHELRVRPVEDEQRPTQSARRGRSIRPGSPDPLSAMPARKAGQTRGL